MQIMFRVAALAALLGLAASVQLRNGGGEQFFSYDYASHGKDWTAGSCSSKARQSPVDLPNVAKLTGTFQYKYEPVTAPFDFLNNGHSFSADFAGQGYGGITYDGVWYDLLMINVHADSEHAWAGVRKPVELHMVHKHFATEKLLVVAVAVEKGPNTTMTPPVSLAQYNLRKESNQIPAYAAFAGSYSAPPATDPNFNPTLQAFLHQQPPPVNTKVSVPASKTNFFDFSYLVSGGGTFYEYAGSLTAPPCAEIATWLVRKEVLKASDKQVFALHDAIYKTTAEFGNYRELQPLNGRKIVMRRGTLEDPPQTGNKKEAAPGLPEGADREFKAMKWSMNAMNIAKSSINYIADLDSRLRNAAAAHAKALAPELGPPEPGFPYGRPINGRITTTTLDPYGPGGSMSGPGGAFGMSDPATQKAAMAMVNGPGGLGEIARQEVEEATWQITKQAKAASIKAAIEAATMIRTGNAADAGILTMANTVPTIPPAPAAALPAPAILGAR